jgi:UDP-N-acetylglucosamine--N-acetylmuramyl-(pentapeptide) pyrophosphoryl-undecaprenol N-acetylglucosamine transferase
VQEGESLRCLIAAGGTAGHVLPALAVADALRERGVAVTIAGTRGRAEARLAPEAGYELDTFEVAGIPRRSPRGALAAAALGVRAPFACTRILERRRPDVVLGGGGYVAGPMVLAAWTKRIPAALTEADAHLGLANRLAAPFAKRVFLAFPIEGRDPPKYRVVGRPIPARSHTTEQAQAKERFDLPADSPVVLVFGGSQGARALNEHVVERFSADGPSILHISGERDYESLRTRVRRPTYRLVPFTDDFGAAISAADVVVARAGGSVWEIAAAGKPAVLVPYPHGTADHQTKNARYFERGGAAVLVPETELERVRDEVAALLADDERRTAMATAMRRLAQPDAANVIAEELIALARAARR